ALSMAAVLLVGGWLVMEDAVQVGMLTAFLLYVRRFYGPLDSLVQAITMYQSASAALEKITVVLDAAPEVVEPTSPTPLPEQAGAGAGAAGASAGPGAGAAGSGAGAAGAAAGGRTVEFTDVEFSYADGEP